jgi:hypothetical protein
VGVLETEGQEMAIKYHVGNMDIGKMGPCMVPGHAKYHVLELSPCWSSMRRYLHDHTWNEFMKRVEEK